MTNAAPAAQRSRRWRRPLGLIVACALAIAALLLALRGVDEGAMVEILGDADPWWLLAAFVTVTLSYATRGERWRLLLAQGGGIGHLQAFWATNLGYLGNNLLPARAGEPLRAAAVARAGNMPLGFVLATALVERLFDTVGLLVIAAIAVVIAPDPPAILVQALAPMLVLSLAAAAVLLAGPRFVLRRLHARPAVTSRLEVPIARFDEGARSLHGRARVTAFVGLTIVAWSLDALAAVFVALACSSALGWGEAVIFIAALAFASAVPSTPGYVGLYQLVAVTVLPPFGIDRESALAIVLALQGVTIVVSVAFGLVAIRELGWRVVRNSVEAAVSGPEEDPEFPDSLRRQGPPTGTMSSR